MTEDKPHYDLTGPKESEEPCGPDCPECGGNGYVGGDVKSPWACTRWLRRVRRNMDRESLAKNNA